MAPQLDYHWRPFAELSLDELYAVLRLRQEVFAVEQQCNYLDADGLDQQAWHLMGMREGQLLAYVRAFPAGVVYPGYAAIGRVITAAPIRGQGLGRPLMHLAMERVWDTFGPGPIKLSAQAHLADYYGSLGFEVCGEGYLEDHIPHLPMRHPGPGASHPLP